MSNYSGFHIGIVVENNDPNFGGRVKVWVPENSPNLDKLNNWIKEGKEITFNAPDSEISPELMEIWDELKEYLPWAEYAGPIFGGSSTGRFHCPTKKTALNDGKEFGDSEAQNGFRPLNNYVGTGAEIDDFMRADANGTVVNPNASDFVPTNYSGMARGIFSIPNVGAQVYVFYLAEDPMYPVYFATSYNTEAIKQIYTKKQNLNETLEPGETHDYPADFENSNKDTDDSKVFRSKTVINSNKHTIEFVDSDGRESLRIQHFGGGFKEFNNATNIEFAPANDQKLVMGDQFETVKGSRGFSVGGDFGIKLNKNYEEQIGHFNDVAKAYAELKPTIDDIGQRLRLFDVKRTASGLPPRDCSPLQQRVAQSGVGFVKCPTCGGIAYDPYKVNGLNIAGTFNEDTKDSSGYTTFTGSGEKGNETTKYHEEFSVKGPDEDTMDRQTYGWSRIPKALEYCTALFEDREPYFYSNHAEHDGYGKVGVFGGVHCPTCNNTFWREGTGTKIWAVEELTGYSPSTENGNWLNENLKFVDLPKLLQDALYKTAGIFANIGEQGTKIEKITSSKVEVIGAMFNDVPSFRVDPIGKIRLDGLFVTQQSTVPYYLPSPHVEPVDVPQIPGGDYNLTIGNKWVVSVGSNGIIIQTTGGLQMSGGISQIATEELTLSSKHDMVIDGGERITIRGRKVTINPVEHNALTIDGQLHVLRNTIVRGGLLAEGEVAVQHVTAPGEIAVTGFEMYEEMSSIVTSSTGDGEESETGENAGCEINVTIQLGLAAEGIELPDMSGTGLDSGSGSGSGGSAKKSCSGKHGLSKIKCKAREYRNKLQDKLGHGWGNVAYFATAGIATGGNQLSLPVAEWLSGGNFGIKKTLGSMLGTEGMKSGIEAVAESLNGVIEMLKAPMDAILIMPPHRHAFLQIPTSFKDCPNGVRAQLLLPGNNINSRTLLLAARRRHHTGTFQPDPKMAELYRANKTFFDRMVWESMVTGAAEMQADLTGKKGINQGVPVSEGEPNAKAFAMFIDGYSDGNQGKLSFYTIRDYYYSATGTDHAIATADGSTFAACICIVEFTLTSDADDIYSPDATTSLGQTGTSADQEAGFVKDSVRAGMRGTSGYGSKNSKGCPEMLAAWIAAYDTTP